MRHLIQANGINRARRALPASAACRRGLVAVRAGRRGILATVMVALVAFCLLALASVGLLSPLAAAALIIAVVGWRQALCPTADQPAGQVRLGVSGT